jgi:hypothetical protein
MKAEKKGRQSKSTVVEPGHLKGFIAFDQEPEEKASACPFNKREENEPEQTSPDWTKEALDRLQQVPAGFMRNMTRKRIEEFARDFHHELITPGVMEDKYAQWGQGSDRQHQNLTWEAAARARLEAIPPFVRGMVMKEVENCAVDQGAEIVTAGIMDKAGKSWEGSMNFHSKPGGTQEQNSE